MNIQTTFKRYELKYMLTRDQHQALLAAMEGKMMLDEFGHHKISNIYFDTQDFRIVRNSIEKPKYKEKLRVRCYGEPSESPKAFIELKKKCKGIVYKRRLCTSQSEAFSFLCRGEKLAEESQIAKEISYFKSSYEDLGPAVYLSYEREAYFSTENEDFRMTFDVNIKTRNQHVSLCENELDRPVLSEDYVLLEVKTPGGLPFWFVDFLAKEGVYKTSFSKYGTAYETYILPEFLEALRGACVG